MGSPSGNLRRIAGLSSDKISLRSIVLIAAAMLCFAANSISPSIGVGSWSYWRSQLYHGEIFGAAMLSGVVYFFQRQIPRVSQVGLASAIALLGYLTLFWFAYARLDAGSGALILIGAVQITMFGSQYWRCQHNQSMRILRQYFQERPV